LEGKIIWGIIKDAVTTHISPSLVLLPTKFCWILTGNSNGITGIVIMVIHKILENLGKDLRRFWDLETIGITPNQQKPLTAGDSQILQEFRDSYHIEHVSRVVRLPKKYICDLSLNRETAESTFRTLHNRIQQDDALRTISEELMLDHVMKDHVELATNTENSFRVFLSATPCGEEGTPFEYQVENSLRRFLRRRQ